MILRPHAFCGAVRDAWVEEEEVPVPECNGKPLLWKDEVLDYLSVHEVGLVLVQRAAVHVHNKLGEDEIAINV